MIMEGPKSRMGNQESLIRARYAVSILRVAKGVPRQEAITLIEGLSRDRVNMELNETIASARADTRNACNQLIAALREDSPTLYIAWEQAAHAAERWLETVNRRPDSQGSR